MQLSIPDALAAILPLIATLLSGWLSSDNLKPAINALIALAALIITAIVCFLLTGNLTGNWATSVLAVLGYVALLMNGDLAVLRQYLISNGASPGYKPASVAASSLAYVPGDRAPGVPPRASKEQ